MTPTDGDSALEARLAAAFAGAYTIETEIGRGGMGVVYRARDEKLKRTVAVKVLPPELAFRRDIRARFIREAETAARLSHPNIVPIHTVGEANDLVYFVMGFVDGESLSLRIKRRGRLSIDESRRIMRETADALAAAHQQGVIHRDVKPDNILLEGTRGRVMVTDFGIAKALSAEGGTLTDTGIAIGTPAFMSPEQAAGERVIDGRSDLYSLGVVAYQMLAGELPFQAPTVPGLLMKQIGTPAVPVERLRPDMPGELAQTVMRCLEKDPEDRWPTADALRRALETGTYTPPQARPTGRRSTPAASARDLPSAREPDPAARWLQERRSRQSERLDRVRDKIERRLDKADRKLERRAEEEREIARRAAQTGEPLMVVQLRHRLARYLSINGMLMLVNLTFAGGLHNPWFIIPAVAMGWGLARDYSHLWTAGYSWRDVLHRPPAPDAIEAKTGRGSLRVPVSPDELGSHAASIEQAGRDRAAILGMLERMPKSERKMLPDVGPTVDQLLGRATDLARTLAALERDIDTAAEDKIDLRITALETEPPSADRERRISLLQRQRQTVHDLVARRVALGSQLESCLLAMQNVRLDLLRLRSAGVAEALGDLTQATQQARSLSRDVDAAVSAAVEIRRLTGREAGPPPG
ncbi:MAG TPA: serine/threonine-protein kinase [Gemmatimonadales bacterium]|nr:serine/threonine-protein kinase [Gemmatimonadales bacterium]